MTTLKYRAKNIQDSGFRIQTYIIAIDGLSGSGKSTLAKLLAKKLDFLYIDSGAMYRAVTLFLIQKKMLNAPNKAIKKCLRDIQIKTSSKIRSSLVNKHVSYVSSLKVVRKEMTKRQREFAKHNFVIMDGRDIGTSVFPKANLKIYLTANSIVRAKRQLFDLKNLGEKNNLKEMIKQINYRDNYDSSRKISPLCKAQDAIVIDSSFLTIDEVLNKVNYFIPMIRK